MRGVRGAVVGGGRGVVCGGRQGAHCDEALRRGARQPRLELQMYVHMHMCTPRCVCGVWCVVCGVWSVVCGVCGVDGEER